MDALFRIKLRKITVKPFPNGKCLATEHDIVSRGIACWSKMLMLNWVANDIKHETLFEFSDLKRCLNWKMFGHQTMFDRVQLPNIFPFGQKSSALDKIPSFLSYLSFASLIWTYDDISLPSPIPFRDHEEHKKEIQTFKQLLPKCVSSREIPYTVILSLFYCKLTDITKELEKFKYLPGHFGLTWWQ